MKLTGKCKADFEDWLLSNNKFIESNTPWAAIEIQGFNALKDNMQWGVYLDYFNSVDISIGVYKTDVNKWFGMILRDNRYLNNFKTPYSNLYEAQISSIEIANEIRNDALNKLASEARSS